MPTDEQKQAAAERAKLRVNSQGEITQVAPAPEAPAEAPAPAEDPVAEAKRFREEAEAKIAAAKAELGPAAELLKSNNPRAFAELVRQSGLSPAEVAAAILAEQRASNEPAKAPTAEELRQAQQVEAQEAHYQRIAERFADHPVSVLKDYARHVDELHQRYYDRVQRRYKKTAKECADEIAENVKANARRMAEVDAPAPATEPETGLVPKPKQPAATTNTAPLTMEERKARARAIASAKAGGFKI